MKTMKTQLNSGLSKLTTIDVSNKKTKVFQIAALILLGGIFCLSSCSTKPKDDKEVANDQNEQKFDTTEIENDAEFAVAAADGGMLEVELGNLVQANASSEEVKMFGEMMVADHTKANDELKALAAQKEITLPVAMSDKNRKVYNDLANKMGKDFDDAYTDFMVKDHKKDIDQFKKQADKGKDPELKSWAAGKVSTLEHHLEMAKQAEAVADSLKKIK